MGGKSKDTRPARAKQKTRSTANKVKQLEAHVKKHPEDKYGKEKLKRARKGNSRATRGAGAPVRVPEVGRQKQGRRK